MLKASAKIKRPRYPRNRKGASLFERTLALVIPILVTASAILLGLVLSPEKTYWLLGHGLFSFVAAGKFIVLGGALPDNPFSPWELALLITYMDTLTGILFVYNVDFFFRIPGLGPRLRMVRLNARRSLQANPWLRRQSYIGVILFVMFPLTGTGAIGAAFLGKFMGLYRFPHLGAICFGGALGGFSMAGLAWWIGRERANQLLDQPYLLGAMILILLGFLALLGRAFFKSSKKRP